MLNLGYKWVKSLHWMKLCIFFVRQGIVGRVFEYHWYAEPSTRRGWRSGKEIVFIHAPRKLPHQLYSYTHLRRIPPLFQAGFSTSPSIPLHLKYPDTKYQWNNSYNITLNTVYNVCNIFCEGKILKWDPLRYAMMSNKVFYFEISPICTIPGWNWHISLPLRWFPLSIWQTWLDKETGTTTTDQKKRALTKCCPDTTFA